MNTSKSCKAAVIGCGVIGPDHVKGFQKCEGVEVAWVCDRVIDKARALSERFAVPRFTDDYRRILDDPGVDCISVCTDHASHTPITIEALAHGKHVLCEKALASSKENLMMMLDAYPKNSGLVFSGVFQHRFDRSYRLLKEIVTRGLLGTALSASMQHRCVRTDQYYTADAWRGTWEQEGGSVLINQSIHFIDILAWVMGGIRSVNGYWANRTHQGSIRTEDTAAVSVEFAGGALGTIEATSSSHIDWEPLITVLGSKGILVLKNAQPARIDCADKELQQQLTDMFAQVPDTGCTWEPFKSYYGPSHPTQIADFIDAIRTGRRPFVTGFDAAHAVDIVLSIYESHRTGQRVRIEPLHSPDQEPLSGVDDVLDRIYR